MNTIDLKALWVSSCTRLSADAASEWAHIEAAYSAPSRHYHTLQHLSDVYADLHEYYAGKVPAATVFALFFHDIIYSALRGDNEKRSAEHTRDMLCKWQADEALINSVAEMIEATATHESGDKETRFFLDADMAILGAESIQYAAYIAAVRREYSVFPDLIYNSGRRKFVEAMLRRDRIFLTDYFYSRYEAQARVNLSNELNQLS